MGDILKAVHDDIEEYIGLCEHFGEEVEKKKTAQGGYLPDAYGEHACSLKDRQQREMRNSNNT